MQEAIAVYSSDELDIDEGGGGDNNVRLKDWLVEDRKKLDAAREAQVLNPLFPLLDRNREATQALFELIKHQPGYG